MKPELVEGIESPVNYTQLAQLAINYSDGIIQNSADTDQSLIQYAQERGVLTLPYQGEEGYEDAFNAFYDQVWGNEE